jgi:hypothetical protein
MTEKERRMAAESHLDEGTIHAWLDDALDAESAARVAAHASTCAACAELVAEARGIIAGASRIVRTLDEESPAAAPEWGVSPAVRAGQSRHWRLLRVTPARAAIAATLLVALGVTLTRPRAAVDTVATASRGAAINPPAAAAQPDDHLLDSAIRRNVAQAQPPRSVEAATGPAIPTAPAAAGAVASADLSAPGRVAAGRAAMRAMLDSSAPIADQSRTAMAPAGAANALMTKRAVAAATKADSSATAQSSGARLNEVVITGTADARLRETECFRVEGVAPGATWGPVALPMVVALNRSGGEQSVGYGDSARILDPASGTDRKVPVTWTRRSADSVELDLGRTKYRGTLELAGTGDLRGGSMRSEPTPRPEAYLAGVDSSAPSEQRTAATATKRRAARATQIPVAKEPLAGPPVSPSPMPPATRAVPIVARRVSCPVP